MKKIGIILISILSFCFLGNSFSARKRPTRRVRAKRYQPSRPVGMARPISTTTRVKPLAPPPSVPPGWMVPKKIKPGPPPKAPIGVAKKPLPLPPTKAKPMPPTPPAPTPWYTPKKI